MCSTVSGERNCSPAYLHTGGWHMLDNVEVLATGVGEIFNLQLVATMLSNSVTRLYTYNQSDFSQFKEIEVLLP